MYWSSRGLSITVTGPDGITTVQLSKPYARVGSRPGSEVLLTHCGVSGRAAYFHATQQGIWCCSLARSGSEPAKLRRIRPGMGIHLGPYRLSANFAVPTAIDHVEKSGNELSTTLKGGLEVEFRSTADDSTVAHVLTGSFAIVGRGAPSNIRLDDERTSRVHCLLYRQEDQLWAIDLLSQNGTRRDGRRAEVICIAPGEHVTIGTYSLSYSSMQSRPSQDDVVPPQSTPMIFEQTIVREQREQIVTRMVAHGGAPISGQTQSHERPIPGTEELFAAIGGSDSPFSEPGKLAEPKSGDQLTIADFVNSPARISGSVPLAITGNAAPAPRALPMPEPAAPSAGAKKTETPPVKASQGRAKQDKAPASTRPVSPSVRKAGPLAEAVADRSGNEVLDRLIDVSTRQTGRARRRVLIMCAIIVAAIVVAAIGLFVLKQMISGSGAP